MNRRNTHTHTPLPTIHRTTQRTVYDQRQTRKNSNASPQNNAGYRRAAGGANHKSSRRGAPCQC
eukprot:2159494-Alexandrium_andersonii.AAC.1